MFDVAISNQHLIMVAIAIAKGVNSKIRLTFILINYMIFIVAAANSSFLQQLVNSIRLLIIIPSAPLAAIPMLEAVLG